MKAHYDDPAEQILDAALESGMLDNKIRFERVASTSEYEVRVKAKRDGRWLKVQSLDRVSAVTGGRMAKEFFGYLGWWVYVVVDGEERDYERELRAGREYFSISETAA